MEVLSPEFISLTRELLPHERARVQAYFLSQRKDPVAATLLAVFTGWAGGHHFYMGSVGFGVLYALLFWTLIPFLLGLIESFFQPSRARRWNARYLQSLVAMTKQERPPENDRPAPSQ